MDHAVAHAVQVPASGVFNARQDLSQGGLVIGIRDFHAFLAGGTFEVDDRFRAADAFGETLQRKSGLRLIDQGELPQLITRMLRADIGGPQCLNVIEISGR